MGLLKSRRCVRFAHTGNPLVADLRGMALFRSLRWIYRARRILGEKARIHIGAELTNQPCPSELLYILMPSTGAIADEIERRATQPSLTVVVDYHGDVLRLLDRDDAPRDMVDASFDGQGDEDSWGWWSDPDRQDAMERSLRAADLVTTPWPALVEPLRALNPNVALVPDLPQRTKLADVQDDHQAYRRFAETVLHAGQPSR